MNAITSLFVKKYATGALTRAIQALGVWLVVKEHFSTADAAALQGAIDPAAVVGWLLTVIPEAVHAWQNKGHAAAVAVVKVTYDSFQQVAPATPPSSQQTPQHGASGLSGTLAVLLLLSGCLTASAQTNALLATGAGALSTNANFTLPLIQISGVSSNTLTVANDVAQMVSPLAPFLTNHNITLGAAPLLYQGKFGEIADLRMPISEGSQASVGIGEVYAVKQLFVCPFSGKIGTSVTIPYINRLFYIWAAEGACLGFKGGPNMGSETTAGAITSWDINKQLNFNTEGGGVKITQLSGVGYFVGGSFNWHPPKW